jgi:malonyl-CoA O-methyltransferase
MDPKTTQSDKHHIADSFSQGAVTYDHYADVQQYAAASLIRKLQEHRRKCPVSVLEIGCGTGFVTTQLLQACPEVHIEAVDISAGMLDVCRIDSVVESAQGPACAVESSICIL